MMRETGSWLIKVSESGVKCCAIFCLKLKMMLGYILKNLFFECVNIFYNRDLAVKKPEMAAFAY
jgi:hypothetical protein